MGICGNCNWCCSNPMMEWITYLEWNDIKSTVACFLDNFNGRLEILTVSVKFSAHELV
jgi:uncharacterized membrane protein